MVAYSFKKRFVAPILSGRKSQTIRAEGKRLHARPGLLVQLYTGMRTRQCQLILESRCSMVQPILIDWHLGTIMLGSDMVEDLEDFAQRDGFADLAEMRAFWQAEHPGILTFPGFVIRWTPPAMVPAEMGARIAA
jgi:hypothetical protein